jgi:two-component system, LytTR family, response regulator
MRVLLVDDEAPGLAALRNLLGREEGVEVVEACTDGVSAVAAVRALKPDLVFLDIQMPGLDGFGVLAELAPEGLPLVVFVTAYDQYCLRAFQVHAVDYLLKPCGREALHGALERARDLLASRRNREPDSMLDLLEDVERERGQRLRFVAREGARALFVPVDQVEAIEATGNYMHLHVDGRTHMIRETLAGLLDRLPPSFVRVHRSWIVNALKLRELAPQGRGTWIARLEGGSEAPVSRQGREALDTFLRGHLTL